MRIVIDSKSKAWANFWSVVLGLFILFLILLVSAAIEHYTKDNLDFETGFVCASHMFKYRWLA